jgi:mono/diheme cytochrome c family protein
MRYFLLIFGLVVIAVVLIAGRRGDLSRNRPIQIFPDMKRQLKLRPQTPNAFFASGLSSQLAQPGTIAQSGPLLVGGREVYPFEDNPAITGRVPGATNYVELNPYPITGQLLQRGHRQYNIYCAPCHGQTGDGNGIVKKFGMLTVRSLHEVIVVRQPDGELFHTVSAGKSTMQGYAAQIPVEDRWAIIAYLRALHLSHLGSVEDLGPEVRAKLR